MSKAYIEEYSVETARALMSSNCDRCGWKGKGDCDETIGSIACLDVAERCGYKIIGLDALKED